MQRVLQVIKFADNSGAPRHVFTLMTRGRTRFDIQLCVGIADPYQQRYVRDGFRIHVLDVLGRRATPLQAIQSVRALLSLLRRERIDLVHVHSPLAGATARIASAIAGIPCVFTAHGWNFAPGLPWRRRISSWLLEWLVARLGQPIITVSAYDGALATRAHVARAPQLRVILNGIADRDPPPARESEGVPVIVMVARFWDQKRQQDVIQAIAGIERPLRLRFVGDGDTWADCEALACRLGQQQRIEFLGRLDSAQAVLDAADIFVLSSNFEGLPLSILEAMRAGLPVVASSVGGVGELVEHDRTGLLFERGDVDTLRAHLIRLLEDGELRQRMGAAGRERFASSFTEARMLHDTFALYERLLAGRTPS